MKFLPRFIIISLIACTVTASFSYVNAQGWLDPLNPPPINNPSQPVSTDGLEGYVRRNTADAPDPDIVQAVAGPVNVITDYSQSFFGGDTLAPLSAPNASIASINAAMSSLTIQQSTGVFGYGVNKGIFGFTEAAYSSTLTAAGIGGRSSAMSATDPAGLFFGPVSVTTAGNGAPGDVSIESNLIARKGLSCTTAACILTSGEAWLRGTHSNSGTGIFGEASDREGVKGTIDLSVFSENAQGAYATSDTGYGAAGYGAPGIYSSIAGSDNAGTYIAAFGEGGTAGAYGLTEGGIGTNGDMAAGVYACYKDAGAVQNKFGIQGAGGEYAGYFDGDFGAQSCPVGWWNCNWEKRVKISFNNNVSGSSLSNFPVKISIPQGSVLYNDIDNNGNDLRFIDTDGTLLSYELEKYSETEESIVWVKVPDLATGTGDYIWMYYKNSSATDAQNSNAVWDNGFQAVWHLDESPANGIAGHSDSTGLLHTGTPQGFGGVSGSTTNAAGTIDGADHFDGTNDRVEMSSFDISGTAMTISAWVKADVLSSSVDHRIVSKAYGTAEADHIWMMGTTNTNKLRFRLKTNGTTKTLIATNGSLSTGVWSLATVVYDGSFMKIYKDGVETTYNTSNAKTLSITSDNVPVWIGGNPVGGQYFDGTIDEVRVSSAARSLGWIKAEYENGKAGSTFVSLGTPEDLALPLPDGLDDGDVLVTGNSSGTVLKIGSESITEAIICSLFKKAGINGTTCP